MIPSAALSIAIDTAPLTDLLLGEFWLATRHSFPKQHLEFVHNEREFRLLSEFIFTRKAVTTAPENIAEVHRHLLRRKLRPEIISKFWGFGQTLFLMGKFLETWDKLADMMPHELEEFGPTDTALLQVVREEKRRFTLLTTDWHLIGHCTKNHLRAIHLDLVTHPIV